MNWNLDISMAPRGQTIKVMRNTKTRDGVIRVPADEFKPDVLWLASDCGKVLRSYWIPANKHHNGYWAGFAQQGGKPPVAWQPYIVPDHPSAAKPDATVAGGHGQFILDDCGSGA